MLSFPLQYTQTGPIPKLLHKINLTWCRPSGMDTVLSDSAHEATRCWNWVFHSSTPLGSRIHMRILKVKATNNKISMLHRLWPNLSLVVQIIVKGCGFIVPRNYRPRMPEHQHQSIQLGGKKTTPKNPIKGNKQNQQ